MSKNKNLNIRIEEDFKKKVKKTAKKYGGISAFTLMLYRSFIDTQENKNADAR